MKINFTEYLYYGKYPYKIIFNIRKRDPDLSRMVLNLKELDIKLTNKQIRHTNKIKLFAYIDDLIIYEMIKSAYSSYINECKQPINEYHLSLLSENYGYALFRDSIFYNRFNYMLSFKTMNDLNNKINISELLTASSFINGIDYSMTPTSVSANLYTSSLELIDLLLITHSEYLLSIKQAIPFSMVIEREPIKFWKDL